MNLISLGKFDEIKKENHYPNFYHLAMIVRLGNGQLLKIEKNATVEINLHGGNPDGVESLHVMNNPITLQQFLDRALSYMGDTRFYTYDSKVNNCQVFIANILRANGLLTEQINNFVMQDINKMPAYTQAIARKVTDLGHRADILINGAGYILPP